MLKKKNDNLNQDFTNDSVDAESLMRKYDKESNTRIWEGIPAVIVRYICASFSLYCILSTLFSTAALEKRITLFVGCVMIMGYLTYPVNKHHVKVNFVPWYDYVIMALGSAAFIYYAATYDKLIIILSSASKMTPTYIIIGIVGILCLMELCRRCVGVPILCVAGVLLIYTFTTGLGLKRLLYTLFYSTGGVLGTPIQVCAKYIAVFIIFGAFLERTGIAAFFISCANALVGRYSGGPAKVAVISSALCGMVSGSSVGNTVTTGSVTIPMMKETGYKPEFAAAVEASASTGGQIMPPIMGAAAFLMAEYMNITYAEVAVKAILPAVLYFAGIFIAVHLEARKLHLKGIPESQLPKVRHLINKIYLLTPLVLLVWLVSSGTKTMQYSATLAIIATIFVNLFDKDNRINLAKVINAMEAGGKSTITVAVACCMAGIVSGCITATGLASRIINTVVMMSNQVTFINPQFIALFLTMFCCIILGMGVPTTANYCIMASTCAPILITMGVPKIAAHFFVFYFGIVADITPPVALAAYAGAAIAKANPMKTGINATKLAVGAFVVPYIFSLNPAMLFVDTTPLEVATIIVTSIFGIFGVAASLNGYVFKPMHWIIRIGFFIGGICMLSPGLATDLIGTALLAIGMLWQFTSNKKRQLQLEANGVDELNQEE